MRKRLSHEEKIKIKKNFVRIYIDYRQGMIANARGVGGRGIPQRGRDVSQVERFGDTSDAI
jgi:hypothetical protein